MKPVPRYTLIREQAERLLVELRENTVNDPHLYADYEGYEEGTDIYGEYNRQRKWDSCELCLSHLMKRLQIPRKLIIACVELLESEGKVKKMSSGDWWKVMIDKTAV